MSTQSIQRAVKDYLSTSYGVRDFTETQNSHGKLSFKYNDKVHTLTLPVSPNFDSQSAIEMKKRDIRHDLGPPPQLISQKPKRKLEDMMPAAPFNAPLAALAPLLTMPREYFGRVALYNIKGTTTIKSLRFFFPREDVNKIPAGPYKLKKLAIDKWELIPTNSTSRSGWLRYGTSEYFLYLAFYVNVNKISTDNFKQMSAKFIVNSNSIVVTFDITKAEPVEFKAKPTFKPPAPKTEIVPSKSVNTPPIRSLIAPKSEPIPTVNDMRACLAEIRRIERLTDRRLMRRTVDKTWVFTAEVIE